MCLLIGTWLILHRRNSGVQCAISRFLTPISGELLRWGLIFSCDSQWSAQPTPLRLLQNNAISGTIPATIGRLGMLKTLDMSDNHLTGSIPSSVGDLKNLNYLKLNNNSLSGAFCKNFQNITLMSCHCRMKMSCRCRMKMSCRCRMKKSWRCRMKTTCRCRMKTTCCRRMKERGELEAGELE
ncbi:uncharacterized protein [Lolium perenne]|uniref:uncharacterized protein isoform X1 n=1 Tax=Lolium perenne TaxID=4522 RepID=UPI003A98F7A6